MTHEPAALLLETRGRPHADTGTPLGEHVCEARVVGDCECLEQPAAPAVVAQPGKEG